MDVTNLSKTRAEAKLIGGKYYFTGEPCVRGHIAPRKIKGTCLECAKEDWTKDNEKRKSKPKSEAAKEAGRRYYEKNRATVIAKAASRSPVDRKAARDRHKQNNPEVYKELVSLRRKRFRMATPKWLTPEQKIEIRLQYRIAMELTKATGVRHVVDHITPLHGREVCGLHVPWNLRVITQAENLQKSNKLVDTASAE